MPSSVVNLRGLRYSVATPGIHSGSEIVRLQMLCSLHCEQELVERMLNSLDVRISVRRTPMTVIGTTHGTEPPIPPLWAFSSHVSLE